MMKRLLSITSFCLLATFSFGQILTPVSWDFATEKTGNDEYLITFSANVDEGWVIYSQYLESDDGPIPTEFIFDNLNGAELVGQNKEHGTMKEEYDSLFEMNLKKLSGKVDFKQTIKGKSGSNVVGYLTYMTCDSERCLPPTNVEFDITLP